MPYMSLCCVPAISAPHILCLLVNCSLLVTAFLFCLNFFSFGNFSPSVGSGAVRIGPLRFLTGGSKSHTLDCFVS